jgi:SRSO17 transposase
LVETIPGSFNPFRELGLRHKPRRRMCPLYISGLIGPDDRKSVQPMAERLASGDYDQLHYFVAAGVWDAAPLETELLIQADRLVGGGDAVLVIDDTALRFVTFGICSPRTGAQGRQLKILCEA